MNKNSSNLTIKYLIDLLNDKQLIRIDRRKYLIDTFPTLKIGEQISYNNLLYLIMIAYKNIKYKIDEDTLKIIIDDVVIKTEKQNIQKTIYDSSIESSKKKKFINHIISQTNKEEQASNENILILTYYFGVNLIIYNSVSQIIKCYYYDNFLDKEQPFIVIKETKDKNSSHTFYELVYLQNKYVFEHNDPLIKELMANTFIVGLEQNKRLEYLVTNKVSEEYTNIKQINMKIIKIRLVPTKSINMINKLRSTNYYKIKIKKNII